MEIAKRLKWYPFVLIPGPLFGSINRIYALVSGKGNVGLTITQVICFSLKGCFESILYGFDTQVREIIVRNGKCCSQTPNQQQDPPVDRANPQEQDSAPGSPRPVPGPLRLLPGSPRPAPGSSRPAHEKYLAVDIDNKL